MNTTTQILLGVGLGALVMLAATSLVTGERFDEQIHRALSQTEQCMDNLVSARNDCVGRQNGVWVQRCDVAVRDGD